MQQPPSLISSSFVPSSIDRRVSQMRGLCVFPDHSLVAERIIVIYRISYFRTPSFAMMLAICEDESTFSGLSRRSLI